MSAYYAGWTHGCGADSRLSPREIDYDAVTHVFHFAVVPKPDGSIDYSKKCITPGNSSELIHAAHGAGRKVLISVGGQMTESLFLRATEDERMPDFINNLLVFMTSRGYDGIDIDWEPISPSSFQRYGAFIRALRKALDKVSPHLLLAAAVKNQPLLFKDLEDQFDQINIMTYCLSGPWPGWIVWHNAPIYDAGYRFPSTGAPVPSANGLIDKYVSAGVDSRKLGIGIAFFGYAWTGGSGTITGGVTAPGQSWTTAPSMEEIPYHEIMERYYRSRDYRWDNDARAAYLSIDNEGSAGDMFISYDDEKACREKIGYAREKKIGGVIIFELGGGWMPKAPVPDHLLQSVKDAVQSVPGPASVEKN